MLIHFAMHSTLPCWKIVSHLALNVVIFLMFVLNSLSRLVSGLGF